MKISEVIAALTDVKAKYGDMPVYADAYVEIVCIVFEERKEGFSPPCPELDGKRLPFSIPKRAVLS